MNAAERTISISFCQALISFQAADDALWKWVRHAEIMSHLLSCQLRRQMFPVKICASCLGEQPKNSWHNSAQWLSMIGVLGWLKGMRVTVPEPRKSVE